LGHLWQRHRRETYLVPHVSTDCLGLGSGEAGPRRPHAQVPLLPMPSISHIQWCAAVPANHEQDSSSPASIVSLFMKDHCGRLLRTSNVGRPHSTVFHA
jgi:hypothetical protein